MITTPNNINKAGGFKLKSRWLNRSEQDLPAPDQSGKSPNAAPVGASTPISSECNSSQMNDVSSSSSSIDQDTKIPSEQLAAMESIPLMPVFEKTLDNIYLSKEP